MDCWDARGGVVTDGEVRKMAIEANSTALHVWVLGTCTLSATRFYQLGPRLGSGGLLNTEMPLFGVSSLLSGIL